MLNLKIKRGNRVNMFNSVKSSVFTWRKIKTDVKMNFYTGISSINLFNVIFLLLSPFLQHVRYWRGSSRAQRLSKFRQTYTRCAPQITAKNMRISPNFEYLKFTRFHLVFYGEINTRQFLNNFSELNATLEIARKTDNFDLVFHGEISVR